MDKRTVGRRWTPQEEERKTKPTPEAEGLTPIIVSFLGRVQRKPRGPAQAKASNATEVDDAGMGLAMSDGKVTTATWMRDAISEAQALYLSGATPCGRLKTRDDTSGSQPQLRLPATRARAFQSAPPCSRMRSRSGCRYLDGAGYLADTAAFVGPAAWWRGRGQVPSNRRRPHEMLHVGPLAVTL
ncbi:hypothetical protein S40285_09890 [Stachybotrys chlorohalonatus IBT 40285]|uniref:Uncharacterized protein n=1 Tax=Stachybotrys chlorohalonatus (strain IBT 40285) TaxID=1283841 RepID=A0A084QY28_STAC4|nr:hypothetical protein S40285_09890 [Stachybotrys chlorohalonata IBT 40285]